MIREGDVIDVKIIKEILLPNGKNALLGKFEQRLYILDKKQFGNHEIAVDETIECHVDKINCSGKVFLSPNKTRSLIGSIEKYKILKIQTVEDTLGNAKYLLHLTSSSATKTQHITYILPTKKSQKYTIRAIEKSKYVLEPINSTACNYTYESEIKVRIIYKTAIQNHGDYYIVEDCFKRKHIISYSKYRHYNLSIGDTLKCRIRGFDKQYNLKLEPTNPKYKLGKVYTFETIGFTDSTNESGNPIKILSVKDCLGMEATIVQLPSNYKLEKTIRAKVYRINNGRLYLSYEID